MKESQRIDQVTHEIQLLKDSQAEIRRDEVNYKMERDLLKEAYGSSIQTVNLSVTFVLGLLAVLGYSRPRKRGLLQPT